jgi:hypothetical protein
MSEMGEVRRDDVRRDGDTGDVPAEATMGDVGGDVGGDVRGGDETRDVPRNATMGGEPGSDARLSTDQIANPGVAQSTAPPPGGGNTGEAEAAQLLDPQDREAMTQRWRDIQANFVDQPRQAMQDADALVAGLMQQLAQMFSQERSQLEGQWSRGDEVSTEDLRVSLQRYRAFFERLLSV